MRKLALFGMVLLATIATSCNKKRTCTCVKTSGIYNPDTMYYAIPRMKTTLAAAECNAKAYYFYGVVYNCKLD
jgi:hypothetical protein